MEPLDEHLEDQLLAYHMGWLDRHEMAQVERLLESSEEVAARSKELSNALAPLDDWTALPAVEDLDTQILHRLQRESGAAVVPLTDTIKLDPVPARRVRVFRFPFSLKEFFTAAACLAVIAGILVPGLARASSLAQRRMCAANFRQIGSALSAYGQDFNEYLPYAALPQSYAGGSDQLPGNWLRERTPGVRRLRNSRNRFLLLSTGYLDDVASFVCPADRKAIVMRFDDAADFDDFAERRNCSYDSQNMFGKVQQVSTHPEMVVYSDSNPLFQKESLGREASAMLNSTTHQGPAGQNVLRLDGAVSWATSPDVGVHHDNIWQIGRRLNYTGSETPQLATDSFMIP